MYYFHFKKEIRLDINEAAKIYPFINEIKAKELSNILHAFSMFRPDFGYISGLIDIAVVFIKHLDEYECF